MRSKGVMCIPSPTPWEGSGVCDILFHRPIYRDKNHSVAMVVSPLINKSEGVFYHCLRTLALQHFGTPVLQTANTNIVVKPCWIVHWGLRIWLSRFRHLPFKKMYGHIYGILFCLFCCTWLYYTLQRPRLQSFFIFYWGNNIGL